MTPNKMLVTDWFNKKKQKKKKEKKRRKKSLYTNYFN